MVSQFLSTTAPVSAGLLPREIERNAALIRPPDPNLNLRCSGKRARGTKGPAPVGQYANQGSAILNELQSGGSASASVAPSPSIILADPHGRVRQEHAFWHKRHV